MRSIRTRLFLSIGSIFLVIAILSYFIPHFFVSRDIGGASTYLNNIYSQYQTRLKQLSGSWVTYRFVNEAAKLSAVSQMIKIKKEKSVWQLAASIARQDPEIAIVQVTNNQNETAVISLEGAQLYIPRWAKDTEDRLWIEITEKKKLFVATDYRRDQTTFLLTENSQEEEKARQLTFTEFANHIPLEPSSKDPEKIYGALREKERRCIEKAKMIGELSKFQGHAAGILKVNSTFEFGKALLAEEVFFDEAFVGTAHATFNPFIFFRTEGPYVNLMQFATLTAPHVVIGYSISAIASEIARIVQKPMIIYNKRAILQAFSAQGDSLPIDAFSTKKERILFEGNEYIPNNISIGTLTFSLLISDSERTVTQKILNQVRVSLIEKISFNLLCLSIALFVIALFLLSRISKRFTKPISQLAIASEDIGKGKYEDLDLPPVEKRHDEVAILSHSFQKMVVSLRDREKIRGVLNKVVSKEIASTILNSSIELGGEQRVLTMLFSDIRGFTPLSENLEPQKLIRLLNSYMTRMCRIIDATHGVVDKFVGDEIMALYGAPLAMPNHAEKAVEAALLMIEDLILWNKEQGEKEPDLSVGMGIHTGTAFAGNMGAEDRLNYTVVGANVNLAARLCSAAKPMQILVSADTYRAISYPEKFHFQKLEPIFLKGIDSPVSIYEVSKI